MKELVILSGKGGTGKTTVAASFAALCQRVVLTDADVDAADLHLVLDHTIESRYEFRSRRQARIRQFECSGCGLCQRHCRFDAVQLAPEVKCDGVFTIDPTACEGCGVCVRVCPNRAIEFVECVTGEWYISQTRFGPLVHGQLYPGGENSGKLVAQVRSVARQLAEQHKVNLIITDGPPGIGCPAIAAVSGADAVLVVTEPTVAGAHDLERVLKLVRHFDVRAFVTVNKWDINPEQTSQIELRAADFGAHLLGRIPYDPDVLDALVNCKPVVELATSQAAGQIRQIWAQLQKWLDQV